MSASRKGIASPGRLPILEHGQYLHRIHRRPPLRRGPRSVSCQDRDRCSHRQQRQRRILFTHRPRRHRSRNLHEHNLAMAAKERPRCERNDRQRKQGDVAGRATADRGPTVRGSHSAAGQHTAARTARECRAQLPGAQSLPAEIDRPTKFFWEGAAESGGKSQIPGSKSQVNPKDSNQKLHGFPPCRRSGRIREGGL